MHHFINIIERLAEYALFLCGMVSIATTGLILSILFAEGIQFFKEVSLAQFFLDTQWTPLFTDQHFGIWPLLTGTLVTSTIAIMVAVPFGVLAAVYLGEFATARRRRVLKPLLELLAGVPTIVYGYFALVYLTPLLQKILPGLGGFNALSPGIMIGLMIVPMISSLSEDAIFAVPQHLREAGLALGARRLSVIFKVVLPAAFSGIAAAVTLAMSRAIGETMIVAIAAGQRPILTLDVREPIETMTAYIVKVSMGDVPHDSLEYRTIFVVGGALFLLTFCINWLSFRMARRFRKAMA
jgi:phosphate transport system permease protein